MPAAGARARRVRGRRARLLPRVRGREPAGAAAGDHARAEGARAQEAGRGGAGAGEGR